MRGRPLMDWPGCPVFEEVTNEDRCEVMIQKKHICKTIDCPQYRRECKRRYYIREAVTTLAILLFFAAGAAAWAIVASPGETVPLRLQITSGAVGVTGLKPKVKIVRQDGTVMQNSTTMMPKDGIAGVYGYDYTCPAGTGHYTAYENTTGMYAVSDSVPIDATNMGGTAYVNNTAIANSVAARIHLVNILPFQGAVSYAGPVATKSTVRAIQGDTPTLKASIKQSGGAALDLTGWTVTWAVKKNMTDAVYVIGPRDITADVESPATGGVVDINFQAADTSGIATGLYYGEIKLYKGGQVLTGWQCNLYVDPAVIH